MTRWQYRAFLKRFDRSKWATLKKRRNSLLPESARSGRQPLYTIPQLREALESSAKKVWPLSARDARQPNGGTRSAKIRNTSRSREALSETAWTLGMRPAHPKVLVSRYVMSSEYVRTKVRDSDDKQVRSLWKKLVTAVENTEGQYRLYKDTGRL